MNYWISYQWNIVQVIYLLYSRTSFCGVEVNTFAWQVESPEFEPKYRPSFYQNDLIKTSVHALKHWLSKILFTLLYKLLWCEG